MYKENVLVVLRVVFIVYMQVSLYFEHDESRPETAILSTLKLLKYYYYYFLVIIIFNRCWPDTSTCLDEVQKLSVYCVIYQHRVS